MKIRAAHEGAAGATAEASLKEKSTVRAIVKAQAALKKAVFRVTNQMLQKAEIEKEYRNFEAFRKILDRAIVHNWQGSRNKSRWTAPQTSFNASRSLL